MMGRTVQVDRLASSKTSRQKMSDRYQKLREGQSEEVSILRWGQVLGQGQSTQRGL